MSNLFSKPSCFYHPITTVFLDDNQGFLDALAFEYQGQKNKIMASDPAEVMALITRNNKENLLEAILVNEKEDEVKNLISSLAIRNMVNITYDNARFDNIAVLVVDYKMPNMNGVEFCQKLKGKLLFKILLTAEADQNTAVQAFNEGIIDKFILKTSSNLYQELNDAINELTSRYFNVVSQIILQSCGASLSKLFKFKPYTDLFHSIASKIHAVEYYLVDKNGSYLFLTQDADPTWLILCDQNKANEDIELLRGYDFSDSLVQQIMNREKNLFLFSDTEYKEPMDQWKNYIFDAKPLEQDYHYSVVNGRLTTSINWQSIAPYSQT